MLKVALACVLLAAVSSPALALRDSYQEPRPDRGGVVEGRYVAPGGDRNHIYNGKRVLGADMDNRGRDRSPYSQRHNGHSGGHNQGYQRGR